MVRTGQHLNTTEGRALYVMQIFLPLRDNNSAAFPKENYTRVREELTDRFGGLTAYTRQPAEGLWKDEQNVAHRDEIVIFEVMAAEFERSWWQAYKCQLKQKFSQDEIIIRVQQILIL